MRSFDGVDLELRRREENAFSIRSGGDAAKGRRRIRATLAKNVMVSSLWVVAFFFTRVCVCVRATARLMGRTNTFSETSRNKLGKNRRR